MPHGVRGSALLGKSAISGSRPVHSSSNASLASESARSTSRPAGAHQLASEGTGPPAGPPPAPAAGTSRLPAADASSDIRHIVLDFGKTAFPVLEGQSLARSLAQFPESFPDIFRDMVDAGEQSGRPDAVL